MKKVTKVSFSQSNDESQLQQSKKMSQNNQLDVSTSVTTRQTCQNMKLEKQKFESQFFIPHQKLLTYETCSTLGTESDEQGCNKQNIQMCIEQYKNSTIRQKKRSPLKDITQKVIKTQSKQPPYEKQSELREYMNSLFPSLISHSSIPQIKKWRI